MAILAAGPSDESPTVEPVGAAPGAQRPAGLPPAFPDFFRSLTGRDPYPFQAHLADQLGERLLLQAPTGTGKTHAAVARWLWHLVRPDAELTGRRWRLAYCLPTRVLVDQVYADVQHLLDQARTLYGAAAGVNLFRLMGGSVEKEWVEYADQPVVVVGTQDQLLSRALNRGYGIGRTRWPIDFGLLHNDTCWVFDEVQLMDAGLQTSVQLAAFHTARRAVMDVN